MKFYAERPLRRLLQIVADLSAIGVGVLAADAARNVHEQISRLKLPGQHLADAGGRLSGTFDNAARQASEVPLVGDKLADALRSGTEVGNSISTAGRWQVEAVDGLAFWMAIVLFALPVVLLLITWLPLRVRFALRAGTAHRLRRLGRDGVDLLALRALVNHPGRRARDVASLLAGWRESDPEATAVLAGLELRRVGLKTR